MPNTDPKRTSDLLRRLRPMLVAVLMGMGLVGAAQPTDLIISEYVEGSSGTNKYLELYNGTSAPIDLVDYELRLYANGSPTPTSVVLSGTLAAGGVIVYRNSASTIYVGAATNLNAICMFNGNDAVALWKISTASFVDIVGNIGCDPGQNWTATPLSTENISLIRNANICSGITSDPGQTLPANNNTLCPFPSLISEWTSGGTNGVANLGIHTMTCGPTVNFAVATGTDVEDAGTVVITMPLSPATTAAGTITIAVANGAGVTYGAAGDYTTTPAVVSGSITVNVPIGATSASFSINIIDDLATEVSENITFTITGATGGISLGSALVHTFTIVDNDVTPTLNFSTLSISVLENAGFQNFQLSISPAAPSAGSLTIQVNDGLGVVYGAGNDYFTAPAVVGGVITIAFSAGATAVNFSATVVNDVLPEDTENIGFTILTVPAGYVIGSNANSALVIGDNDTPPTVLEPGDLAVLGVNASNFACGGSSSEDVISFFCFKPIVPGTSFMITDNGFERVNSGQWGNSEGTVRMTRTGIAIPAGQVITFRITGTAGPGNIVGMAPDASWTCTGLNFPTGASLPTPVALNNGGDQLFFMQGGAWNSGTAPGNVFQHNASYTGSILYGFTTNPTFPWSASNSTQRSNLPPGIECFSMAPTLATDFNKYVGPITAATQRDWIIRVDDSGNWTSYASCLDYNALGYNWLSAPILPIIAGAYVPGRWRGAVSTDWFECKNWDDVRIPVATTDVRIDQTATRNCEVGIVAASSATCASLLQTSNGTIRQLNIRNSSTLQVNGPLRIERLAVGGSLITQVEANSTLQASSVVMEGLTSGNPEAVLRCDQNGSRVLVESNLTIGLGGRLDLSSSPGNSGLLELGGDFINLSDETAFEESQSTVRLNGNVDQIISVSGGAEVFGRLEVLKTGGDVLLASPAYIRSVLNLSSGRIQNNASSLLTMMSGSSAINASDASFVTGPLEKIGSGSFIFPVGKGTVLRPCSLTGITGGTGSAFTAEYFQGNPRVLFGDVVEPTLDHVSACEYWMIDRSLGTPNAFVHLSWREPISCGVTELSSLRVARWDGSIWRDRGNGGATGTLLTGFVPTSAVQTAFSPWTLASISNENPLPITLLSFDAQTAGAVVDLYWATASEMNNEHFTVERSADGNTFLPLLRLPGAGNSTMTLEYGAVDDAPLQGLSYYRLRQTDFDGTSTLSNVVSVRMYSPAGQPLSVHVGDGSMVAFHSFEVGSLYTVLDMTGRLVSTGIAEEEDRLQLSVASLPTGAYVLRMQDGQRSESARFIR